MRQRFEYPANRYVFKSRLNCSESTGGSRRWSGSEFQTVGPAKENARVLLPVLLMKIDNRLLNCTDRHTQPSCTIISYTFTAAGATSRCVTWPDCRIERPFDDTDRSLHVDFSARLTMLKRTIAKGNLSVCLSVCLSVTLVIHADSWKFWYFIQWYFIPISQYKLYSRIILILLI